MEPGTAGWDGEERRRDKVSAEQVEVALVFRQVVGLHDAAEYLLQKDIPDGVAQRVLRDSVYRKH